MKAIEKDMRERSPGKEQENNVKAIEMCEKEGGKGTGQESESHREIYERTFRQERNQLMP